MSIRPLNSWRSNLPVSSSSGKGNLSRFDLDAVIQASVSPSEDPHLVAMAVAKLLGCPEDEVQIGATGVIFKSGGTNSLARIKDQLRDRRVRGAARKLLLSSMEKGKSYLM